MPFRINKETNEPYLQLPAPFSHIIVTPPLLSDVKPNTILLNHPSIYPMLVSPPYPFFEHHSEAFLSECIEFSSKSFSEFKDEILAQSAASKTEFEFIATSTPFQIIREVKIGEDGKEVREYIGDIGFNRSRFLEIEDEEERRKLTEENVRKQKGDPTIVWTFGGTVYFFVHSSI